ncbi:UPF0755 protein [Sphaerotilus hippei]|uniref:Endolytic murein transglycosylase n=1 Tax=Sphaerotilus hippei TaxID=744406 RepID=A0A318H4E3_9BURK|nr:endolytic transglycosylase MltG [Sphaerotilus hippei]PXW98021.1 UPF0755 protein [Sphaerotilus hippei]
MASILLAAGLAGAAYWWLEQPLELAAPTVEVDVQPGQTPRQLAQALTDGGVRTRPVLLYQWFRWSGDARRIRAGSYEFERGITPAALLRKLVAGDETLARVRFIEGWTFRQMRAELNRSTDLRPESATMDDAALMAALGSPGRLPEGQFYPDTYTYSRGSSDLALLRRAHEAMRRRLAEAWAQRTEDHPIQTEQDLLVLASIVEKETGRAEDRGRVAAVFLNRLRLGMPLQTDPTVIYGLGERFDGNLRRIDLQTDTPFNTYTRTGLPPTPIAMPGAAALRAVMQPDRSRALYFVARGDGSSEFSDNLADHNRAVERYQRSGRQR